MGVNRDRAEAVKQLLKEWEVTAEFVQERLGCGHGQALRAIKTARFDLAAAGKRCSYANAANDYTVAVEGDAADRTRSYVVRQQSIITQRRNAAHVMAASVDHGHSSKIERTLGLFAMADQQQAEADQIRLEAFKGLL